MLQSLEELDASHVWQAKVDHAAIERARAKRGERVGARAHRRDVDVVVAEELDDARALALVVLDDEQALLVRLRVGAELVDGALELGRRRGLDQIRQGPVRQPVLTLFFDREHLHGDVSSTGFELEVVENGPAEHVRQKHVECDRGRDELAREREGLLTVA